MFNDKTTGLLNGKNENSLNSKSDLLADLEATAGEALSAGGMMFGMTRAYGVVNRSDAAAAAADAAEAATMAAAAAAAAAAALVDAESSAGALGDATVTGEVCMRPRLNGESESDEPNGGGDDDDCDDCEDDDFAAEANFIVFDDAGSDGTTECSDDAEDADCGLEFEG